MMDRINESALIFDEPIKYKDIKLYPITVENYLEFKNSSDILTINTLEEKDLNLLGLPYLEYIYYKSKTEGKEIMKEKLLYILSLSLKNNMVEIEKNKNNDVLLNIYNKTDKYDDTEANFIEVKKKYIQCCEIDKNSDIVKKLEEELNLLAKNMFDIVSINSTDFDEMKHLICKQNDISEEQIDPKWEKILKSAKEKLSQVNGKQSNVDIRDLLLSLGFILKKTPSELKNLSISTFDRYVTMMVDKEASDFDKNVTAKVIKPKKSLESWIKHYEPKGKYDNVTSSRSESGIDNLK